MNIEVWIGLTKYSSAVHLHWTADTVEQPPNDSSNGRYMLHFYINGEIPFF